MRYTDRDTGELIEGLPACDVNDPADLEAWHGNFGLYGDVRKVLLADCMESVRAENLEVKITEARIEALARTSDTYVQFIVDNLNARRAREQNVRDSLRGQAA